MGKLLWIDDQIEDLKVQRKVLEGAGHVVDVASSAQEAAELLKAKSYDLVMLDLVMPTSGFFEEIETMGGARTGVFFAQYVRLHFPELPVVILSISDPSTYDDELFFANGIERFRKQDYPGKAILDVVQNVSEFECKYNALEAFELKPGLFGIKVDLKNFVRYWNSRKK